MDVVMRRMNGAKGMCGSHTSKLLEINSNHFIGLSDISDITDDFWGQLALVTP